MPDSNACNLGRGKLLVAPEGERGTDDAAGEKIVYFKYGNGALFK